MHRCLAALLVTTFAGSLHAAPRPIAWQDLDPLYVAARQRGVVVTQAGFVSDASYKDPEMVEALLVAYQRRFADLAHLEAIGQSAQGRPIWALRIGRQAAPGAVKPAVLLDGAHHASELLPTEFVMDAVAWLLEGYAVDPQVRRWVDALDIWCVPLVNPDARQFFMVTSTTGGRKNRRDLDGDGRVGELEGVDLNRNYPFMWGVAGESRSRSDPNHPRFRGWSPASEPETQAMMALAEREVFVAAISYHTHATAILPPYAVDGVPAPEGDEAWAIAQELAAAMPVQPNGRRFRVKRRLKRVDGVAKDWLRFAHGTLALVIEGPFHNPREMRRRRASVTAMRPSWMALLQRFLDGPSVRGRVVDVDGRPLAAEVRLLPVLPRAGEVWLSRARDGQFGRFLPLPGAYTLVVSAPGYLSQRRELWIDDAIEVAPVVLRAQRPHLAAASLLE